MRTQPKREIYFEKEFCGTMGHKTKGTYADGSVMHVGDLVAIYHNNKHSSDSLVVKEKSGSVYIMGLKDYNDSYKNGIVAGGLFRIKLLKKYYEVEDGMYRDGILKVVTLENDPYLVPKSKKVTGQKSKSFPITVQVKADLLFDKPTVEKEGDGVFIFTGRTTVYVNNECGLWGMSTCNSNELKSYDKEIGKALAYYRAFTRE